jgi:hypothetical protein
MAAMFRSKALQKDPWLSQLRARKPVMVTAVACSVSWDFDPDKLIRPRSADSIKARGHHAAPIGRTHDRKRLLPAHHSQSPCRPGGYPHMTHYRTLSDLLLYVAGATGREKAPRWRGESSRPTAPKSTSAHGSGRCRRERDSRLTQPIQPDCEVYQDRGVNQGQDNQDIGASPLARMKRW